MFRLFGLAISTFFLCSCYLIGNEKLLLRQMEDVSLPLIDEAISDSQYGFGIIQQTPSYNKYSAKGVSLGLTSYSNIKRSTEALNTEDLALLSYQPIYFFHSESTTINIEYDSRITCLKVRPWTKNWLNYG